MIYFLLFLHFGFNVFVIMCFAAFIFASTQNKLLKNLSIVFLSLYSIIELIWVSFLLINGDKSTVWLIWMTAVFIACIISLTFYFCRKLDITMWGPFSVIFGPLIIIPVLVFLLAINSTAKKLQNTNQSLL
jgi:hypothetical protein